MVPTIDLLLQLVAAPEWRLWLAFYVAAKGYPIQAGKDGESVNSRKLDDRAALAAFLSEMAN